MCDPLRIFRRHLKLVHAGPDAEPIQREASGSWQSEPHEATSSAPDAPTADASAAVVEAAPVSSGEAAPMDTEEAPMIKSSKSRPTKASEDEVADAAGASNPRDEKPVQAEQEYCDRLLDFSSFVRTLASNKFIVSYTVLLRDYRTNSAKLNACIVRMFHRIAVECELESYFYQVSVLQLFNEILQDDRTRDSQFKELRRFIKFVVASFLKRAKLDPMVFVDALYLKMPKRLHLMHEIGSDVWKVRQGLMEPPEKEPHRGGVWTESEESKIRNLCEAVDPENPDYEELLDSLEDALPHRSLVAIKARMKKLGFGRVGMPRKVVCV